MTHTTNHAQPAAALGNKRLLIELDAPSTQAYQTLIKRCMAKQNRESTYESMRLDFASINQHLPDQDDLLKHVLTPMVRQIKEHTRERILIPNTTLSLVLARLQLLQSTAFINPAKELKRALINVCAQSSPNGSAGSCMSFCVLGSASTSQLEVWPQLAKEVSGLEFRALSSSQIHAVDKLRTQVYLDQVTAARLDEFKRLINQLPKNTLKVLACSELTQLYLQEPDLNNAQYNLIDLAHLQVEAFCR